MSFSNDVRLKAQSALKPYLREDSQVKNPILLLNYLYQHAIIPPPRYYVMSKMNQSLHAVSCNIGDLQMIGNGSTIKKAKTDAAQLILNLLLKPVDYSCGHSALNSVSSVSCSASNLQIPLSSNYISCSSTHVLRDPVPPSNTEYQMVNCISNGINRATYLDHNMELSPGQNSEAQVHPQSNVSRENIATGSSELLGEVSVNTFQINSSLSTQKSDCDSNKLSKDFLQGNPSPEAHKHLSYDDFFNPFFRPNKSETPHEVSGNTLQATYLLPPNQSNKVSDGTFLLKSSNAYEQASSDNFFDPFFKQRPPSLNSALIMETKSFEDLVENRNNQSNCDDSNLSTMESKNVFALLQKKTQKHLKLIPRFRIENTESGFRCNVQLGSYYASGEGKNKKEAKTKAAISLLNQVNDLN